MEVYEKVLNQIVIENDIKGAISSAEGFRTTDNCSGSTGYFKKIDQINACRFKTSDKVWWDITNIENPIIILKDELKNEELTTLQTKAKDLSDNTVYAMVGRRDDDLGILRINDNGYEQEQKNNLANQAYMIKLYSFINNSTLNFSEQFKICMAGYESTCTININGENITYKRVTRTDNVSVNYGEGLTSTFVAGNYYTSLFHGPSAEEISIYGDKYTAADELCKKQGAHLANLAESMITKQGYNNTSWIIASEKFSDTGYYIVHAGATINDKWGISKSNIYGSGAYICIVDN